MDKIVNRLCGIETAATGILEAAALEKRDMEQKSSESLKSYDAMVEEETTAKLEKLKSVFDTQIEEELEQLRADTKNTIRSIETDYEMNHAKLAAQIFEKIVAR